MKGRSMKKLNIKNILITGGSGKIGRAVIPELIRAGYKLRAIQLSDELVDVPAVETVTGTLADENMTGNIFSETALFCNSAKPAGMRGTITYIFIF